MEVKKIEIVYERGKYRKLRTQDRENSKFTLHIFQQENSPNTPTNTVREI